MTTNALGTVGRRALLIAPVVIVVAAFFGMLRWFKPQNTAFVLVLAAVASMFVMGYASFLARRLQRRMDEVQIANQGFAYLRGGVWGMAVTILLLLLPPVTNWLIDLANLMSTRSPDQVDRGSVHLALNFGFMLLVLMQTLCSILASVLWWRRMERP